MQAARCDWHDVFNSSSSSSLPIDICLFFQLVSVTDVCAGLELVLGEDVGEAQLRQLATSTDPTIRMRAISLVAVMAAASPEAAAAVRSKGRLSLDVQITLCI